MAEFKFFVPYFFFYFLLMSFNKGVSELVSFMKLTYKKFAKSMSKKFKFSYRFVSSSTLSRSEFVILKISCLNIETNKIKVYRNVNKQNAMY